MGQQDSATSARQFLAATMPFLIIELANRFPADILSGDDPQQKAAQAGAGIGYWQIRPAKYLVDYMVELGVAEYCLDGSELQAVRLKIPFEQVTAHIMNRDDGLIQKTALSNWDEETFRRRFNAFPGLTNKLAVYCLQLEKYLRNYFVKEQISRFAPIKGPYEIDISVEFFALASNDEFSSWALDLATDIDTSLSESPYNLCPYKIEGGVT